LPEEKMKFNDGAAYERMMGSWSRLVGQEFINWLAPKRDLRWLDVGCGNGAFSELISSLCAPLLVKGIDPSSEQIEFANSRSIEAPATFRLGDAMDLPIDESKFDVAVMALVIFFVPDPAQGVMEMVRTVRSGGIVASYTWDTVNKGSPSSLLSSLLREIGFKPQSPPNAKASEMSALKSLWSGAGINAIESHKISVERKFKDINEYWSITSLTPNIQHIIPNLTTGQIDEVKGILQQQLSTASDGSISQVATANAIKGIVKK